jgi:hypothetical protein
MRSPCRKRGEPCHPFARSIAAAFSAIIMVGALVLPEVIAGMTEASATMSPSSLCSRALH